jgi:hypothetical protein
MVSAWFVVSSPHRNIEAFTSVGLIPVELGGFFLTIVPGKARRLVDRQNSNQRVRFSHPMSMAGFGCRQGSEEIMRFLMSFTLPTGRNMVEFSELSAIFRELRSV